MRYTILQATALPGSPSGFFINQDVPLAELTVRATQEIALTVRAAQRIELTVRL